jgi:seryl-tRNA synthetase
VTSSEDFRRELLESGLLVDGGVRGLYHRSFAFEAIARGVEGYVSAAGRDDGPRQLYFPPITTRATLEGSGYLASFPDLVGAVSSFSGAERELPEVLRRAAEGGAWEELLTPTEVALCSAACHPLYPLLVDESLPVEGTLFETQACCFRHEPSDDPARMQSFRQHEFVYVGSPDGALAHRDTWLARGASLLAALGLDVATVVANDPFFGRAGQLLAAGQREKELKYEIVAPISSDTPGAISSANFHEDHFGVAFDLSLDDASVAHTACIGFGLERISLALLHRHGLLVEAWPDEVRASLGLGAPRGAEATS